MMHKRYTGGFKSRANILWEIEIWQESEHAYTVKEIALAAEPLSIEWTEVDKLEPVQSSAATLKLYSDTDRQFIDLYTVVAGSIRLDVYREGALYWCGTLDTELYEEPYSYRDNYEVTLTFGDFAVMSRLNWEGRGYITVMDMVKLCMKRAGIEHLPLTEYVSTTTPEYQTAMTGFVSVLQENFYDEDDEPMTVREVLDGVLKPFALRLMQRGGRVFLYDLNCVYTAVNPHVIEWESTDAAMGFDKTYNNVVLNFSPYEKTDILTGEVDYDSVKETEREFTVRVDDMNIAEPTEPQSADGFKFVISESGKGLTKSAKAKFFKVQPVFSGDKDAGIAWTAKEKQYRTGKYASHINEASPQSGDVIYEISKTGYLPRVDDWIKTQNYRLRLCLRILFDVRYNPYEQDGICNEEGDWDNLINWCNISYVPVILNLRTKYGKVYHYDNRFVHDSMSYRFEGDWKDGEGKPGDAYLCYYDPANRRSASGLGGWRTNRQSIGFYQEDYLPYIFTKRDDGEYIKLPPWDGYLEFKVCSGVECYDFLRENKLLNKKSYFKVRWLLYGKSSISLVDSNGKSLETTEPEHRAWINREARETLNIDTIVGTLDKPSPVAMGQIFTLNGPFAASRVIGKLSRAGTTDSMERLLIGTAYSNYSGRNLTLSGTAAIMPDFRTYSDRNTAGCMFIMASEVQRPMEDECEISLVEFHEDNYEGIVYE